MIPRLYEKNATTFTTYGICPLIDAISCEVTEERNGGYTLTMEYPREGRWATEIIVDRIILAKPHDNATSNQPFRIREVTFDMLGNMIVQAEHISYQLNNYIIGISSVSFTTAATMWTNMVAQHIAGSNPFTFSTDISTVKALTMAIGQPTGLRALLGGTGGMVDVFGGEFEFDGYTVKLHSARGSNNGVKIAYSKNLTGLTYDIDMDGCVSAVVTYWSKEGQSAQNAQATTNTYSYNRFAIVDVSNDYETKPNTATLQTYGQNWLAANASAPTLSVEVNFVPLWQTEEYKDFYALEHVNLCDTVEVLYPPLNIDVQAKVVRTVYDVLLERYTELTISTVKQSLADTIYDLMKGQK